MLAASITRRVGTSAPATIASASPVATMAAARYKGLETIRFAMDSLKPRACTSASTWAWVGGDNGSGSHRPSAFSRAAASPTRGSSISGNTTRTERAFAAAYAFSSTDIDIPFVTRRSQL